MELLNQSSYWLLLIIIVWVLLWKGYSLWIASRNHQKRWFIALLVLNTFAILDIFYIFYVAKKTPSDLLKVFKTKI